MFRAMVWKELREVRGIAIATLAANVYLVAAGAGHSSVFLVVRVGGEMIPFIHDSFIALLGIVCAASAIALGLRQTLGESIGGTYPFLLHRPATRGWLVGVKLLVGAAVYLACNAVSILAYGVWAATPGMHPHPFFWWMTVPSWIVLFGMLSLYLGAFLCGLRVGAWLGTRLLPLVGAALGTYMTIGVTMVQIQSVGLCLVAVLLVTLTTMIFFVARTREYS